MNIYEDLFNEDGSVKDAVVIATAEAITSDTPVSATGTYVLDGVRAEDGYPEDFAGKCLLVVSGTTQPLDTTYVLFANSIIWYKSAKSDTWEKDAGYTNAEYDQIADLRAIISQIRNDIATLKDSFNNTMQVKIDGLLDGKGKLKWSIMPDLIQHNRGVYANETEITKNVTSPVAGDWVINTETDTVWVYDDETSAWVDSDRKGQVTSVNGKTGDVSLPDIYAVVAKGAANLNTLTTQGNYYVNASATNGPGSMDGLVQVYQVTGDVIRQVFWRLGTVNTHGYFVYTRQFNKTTSTYSTWYQVITSAGGTFTGGITAATVTSNGAITAKNGIAVTGNVSATGTVTSTGLVTAKAGVSVTGNVTASGTITSTGALTAKAGVSVTGNVTASGTITSTGALTAKAGVSVTGNVTASGAITSTGALTAKAGVSVTGNVTASGSVSCANPAANSDTNVSATTAWVRDKFAISTASPSGGTDGDFWFQV